MLEVRGDLLCGLALGGFAPAFQTLVQHERYGEVPGPRMRIREFSARGFEPSRGTVLKS